MNKNNFKFIKTNTCALFYKSLLTCLLIISSPFYLKASQSTTLGWKSSLCTGICVYLSSKLSFSQNKGVKEMRLRCKEKEAGVSELIVASSVEEAKEIGNDRGKALVRLYIANTHLSNTVPKQLTTGFRPYEKVCFRLDLSDFIGDKIAKKVVKAHDFSRGKAFSSMSSLKLLTSLFLLSSIPGAGAKVVDNVAFADEGAIACAACIAGCCTALGYGEGPFCVFHCSIGPCAWLCAAPIP